MEGSPRMKTPIRTNGPTPKLVATKPQVSFRRRGGQGVKDVCLRCGHYDECHERQRMGLWVLCEIPDSLDMMRLRNLETFLGIIGGEI